MAAPRTPQDHQKKKTPTSDVFSFEHDGATYEFAPVYDVLTPGFLRANRRRDETDQMFTMFEALADEDTLAVIDVMSRDEFQKLTKDFFKFLEMNPGE